MVKSERRLLLEEKMKQINKGKKDKTLIKFGESKEDSKYISFGIPQIDEFTGGGATQGTFTVIYGGKSVGKTTLALQQIGDAQKKGLICCLIDLEHGWDKERALKFGVNLEELVLVDTAQTAEDAMDIINELAKDKLVDLILVDSINAMSPEAEQITKKGKVKSIADDTMALLARKLGQFFRMVAPQIYRAKIAVVMIGQVRTHGIGSFYTFAGLSGGNCFDIDTRILTKNGLKSLNDIKRGELIPTINLDKKSIEYKPIKEIHQFDFDGNLNQFKDKYNREFLFTDNHKCLVKMFKWDNNIKNSRLDLPFYKIINAKDDRRTYAFPINFPSGNKEHKISDDEIKLIGWILTDGTIEIMDKRRNNWRRYSNRVLIYQSKIKYVKRIRNLLKKLDINFTETKRERTDKRFPNRLFISYVFLINKGRLFSKKYKLNSNKSIPEWMFKLSDRQADILLKEMINGDGNRKNGLDRFICDGDLKNIERIAHFCVTHNIKISKIIKSKEKRCWYLFFRQSDYIGFNNKTQKQYKNIVWDISVDNELHFIERNGQIIATHNSLQHWMSSCIFIRTGQKADAPVEKKKVEITTPDGEKHKKTVTEQIGFDAVIRMDKTKNSRSMSEGTDIHIPFYYKTGFHPPIDFEKERKRLDEELSKNPETDLVNVVTNLFKGNKIDVIIKDDMPEEKPKKKRGRPKKEK